MSRFLIIFVILAVAGLVAWSIVSLLQPASKGGSGEPSCGGNTARVVELGMDRGQALKDAPNRCVNFAYVEKNPAAVGLLQLPDGQFGCCQCEPKWEGLTCDDLITEDDEYCRWRYGPHYEWHNDANACQCAQAFAGNRCELPAYDCKHVSGSTGECASGSQENTYYNTCHICACEGGKEVYFDKGACVDFGDKGGTCAYGKGQGGELEWTEQYGYVVKLHHCHGDEDRQWSSLSRQDGTVTRLPRTPFKSLRPLGAMAACNTGSPISVKADCMVGMVWDGGEYACMCKGCGSSGDLSPAMLSGPRGATFAKCCGEAGCPKSPKKKLACDDDPPWSPALKGDAWGHWCATHSKGGVEQQSQADCCDHCEYDDSDAECGRLGVAELLLAPAAERLAAGLLLAPAAKRPSAEGGWSVE